MLKFSALSVLTILRGNNKTNQYRTSSNTVPFRHKMAGSKTQSNGDMDIESTTLTVLILFGTDASYWHRRTRVSSKKPSSHPVTMKSN